MPSAVNSGWGSPMAYQDWLRDHRDGKTKHITMEAVSDVPYSGAPPSGSA